MTMLRRLAPAAADLVLRCARPVQGLDDADWCCLPGALNHVSGDGDLPHDTTCRTRAKEDG